MLWIFFEDVIFWFWWNATGFVVTTLVALILSATNKSHDPDSVVNPDQIEMRWKESSILTIYFVLIVGLSVSMAILF
jgi:hypothetical protein